MQETAAAAAATERVVVPFAGSLDDPYTAQPQCQKVNAPAAAKNKQAILDVLLQYLPADTQGQRVLHVAEGTGMHIAHFAAAYPGCVWLPSDTTPELFSSIEAWAAGLPNIKLPPLLLDASHERWPVEAGLDGIITINMSHIAPWEATLGLMAGAGKYLRPGGRLFLYGPFKKDNQFTTESNAAFDASLRARNPLWGYRDLDQVAEVAAQHGLQREAVHEMPANNFMSVFTKSSSS